jgi:hypothetical protein
MDELLQKLLEAEVLNEETKKELESAFSTKLTEAVETAKTEAAADVRAELTEQWVQERDALIEAIDTKVDDFLSAELEELKSDIDSFRDLEAEAAEKLVEAKAQMKNEFTNDMGELVEKIDAFLEIRLAAEMEELHEDIEEAKKKDFGRRVFEAFVSEYAKNYADDESLEGTLRETEERLSDTSKALKEAESKLSKMQRADKMTKVLSPLTGRARDVMEAILGNVSTDQLEEGYKTFIGRVLRESEEETSEKEDKVLAEDASEEDSEKLNENTKLVTGDNEEVLEEEEKANKDEHLLSESTRIRMQRLAGIVE